MMKVEVKNKDLLIKELEDLRQRVTELEKKKDERKRVEIKLKKITQEWRSAFNSITDLVSIHDKDYKFVRVNKAYADALKMKPEELIGKTCYEMFHKADEPWSNCPHKQVLETKNQADIEFFAPHLEVHLKVSVSPIFDKVGEVVGTVHIAKDVTELKQADKVLRQSERKYQSLINNVKLGVFRSAPRADGRFLEVNPAMEEITGYSREELLEMNVSDLYAHPNEREAILRKIASTKDKPTKELYFRKKNGTIIAVSDTKVAVKDNEGSILYFDGILEDITKRKRAREELRNSHRQLRDLTAYLQTTREEERKRIAREVHDELGQSLAVLKMDLSWLGKRLLKEQTSLLEKIKTMLELIGNIMKTVRRISTELRPGLLDDLGLIAAIEWHTEEFRNLTGIKCRITSNCDDAVLDQNLSTTIFRIFQETLLNIANHSRATKVKVSLMKENYNLVMVISDNGKGITRKEISNPKSLGLVGMRERALLWGGVLNINGIQDKGTMVTVNIPFKKTSVA